MRFCRVGIHGWTFWAETTTTYERPVWDVIQMKVFDIAPPQLAITVRAQRRECRHCGRMQLRRITS